MMDNVVKAIGEIENVLYLINTKQKDLHEEQVEQDQLLEE
jgi:hypothetical protein